MLDLPPITSVYFSPTTDFGFKKLFGEEANKDLLMDFLNSMLPKDYQCVSLTLKQTEQIPDWEDDRKAIFDILCVNQKGEQFIIEMQKAKITHFIDRTIFYVTFPIQNQAPKGKWNFELKRIFVISILDYNYDTNIDYWKKRQLLRPFDLRDNKGVLMSDKLNFKLLQLPFFNKKPSQLKTHFDKWCYFLKNLETFDVIPKILNEPVFMKAFEVATVAKLDKLDYMLYQMSKYGKYDMELVAEEAIRQGNIEGKIQGKIEGKIEGIIETEERKDRLFVLNSFDNGLDAQLIAKLSSISIDRVLEIIAKNRPSL